MRRIVIWLASTVAAVVLLLAYRTSTMGAVSGGGAPAAPASPGIVPAPSAGSQTADVVVNGKVARTRWGPVQVQVRIRGGKIVDVTALRQPNGNDRDREINSYAIPQLHDEVLAAQSGQIDTVSGATVTSNGYQQSLQSALDAAHFK
jgi:uncharacterized protein with FMN-binding domain